MKNSLESLKKGLDSLSIVLSDQQIEQFQLFYKILIEKNKVMNLTGITQWEDVVQKHFLDSLSLVKVFDLSQAETLIDVGTGAGFPGIPLKIAFPKIKIVLMDSLNKRVLFLKEVIDACQLNQIEAIHSRAEDLARKEIYREQFDICVSRAVAGLNSLSEYCLPFVKVGGNFLSYKAGLVDEEVCHAKAAINILGGKIQTVAKFCLPYSDISRSIICIEKVKNCPKKYPRKAGMATSNPLQ